MRMGVTVAGDRARKVVQMKGEKQGAAEWLRGIIDECEASGTRSCPAIAEAFGIDCKHERTCRDCLLRMMTAIADRIDAERALPDGMEWPRFEDGGLVRIGDEVEFEGKTMRVCEVALYADSWALWCDCEDMSGMLHGSYGERVERPAPKVLDADGVQIKVGDTVYFVDGAGVRHAVKDIIFEPGGPFVGIIDEKVRCPLMVNPDTLTHERPDSWEKLEEDAKLAPRDYLESRGMNPEKPERIASMMADLVRRAKALAKAGEQG